MKSGQSDRLHFTVSLYYVTLHLADALIQSGFQVIRYTRNEHRGVQGKISN